MGQPFAPAELAAELAAVGRTARGYWLLAQCWARRAARAEAAHGELRDTLADYRAALAHYATSGADRGVARRVLSLPEEE